MAATALQSSNTCKYTRWLSRVNSREQRWLRTGKRSFAVLQAAAFFTPNGDGANDYWNLKGLNGSIKIKTKIFIFDRYGTAQTIKPLRSWLGWKL
jgi:hypothetical protein